MHMKGHTSSAVEKRIERRQYKNKRETERQRWREREGDRVRLYLISAEVSIEQKVQQAGSLVKP